MGDALSTGESAARKAARREKRMLAQQKQKEKLALAEEESEIAKRKAAGESGRAGRSLLIRTSEQGATNQLGG